MCIAFVHGRLRANQKLRGTGTKSLGASVRARHGIFLQARRGLGKKIVSTHAEETQDQHSERSRRESMLYIGVVVRTWKQMAMFSHD